MGIGERNVRAHSRSRSPAAPPPRSRRNSAARLLSRRIRRLLTRPLLPSRRLTIHGTFTLIAALNGFVLAYLLVSSLQALAVSGLANPAVVLSLSLTVLLALLAGLSYLIIRRRIVAPIRRLLSEALWIQREDPAGVFSIVGEDEISTLAAGFNEVLRCMRQALMDLDASNRDLLAAREQIEASLAYASLLQRSILPAQELAELFGEQHGLLWLPRDRVGGDWYLVHRAGPRLLLGVGDCAGHGVSGAMMTMLARAALDRAISELGVDSPAALLHRTDAVLRGLLGDADRSEAVATSMDLGLVSLDRQRGDLRFAGARIGLYWSDGQRIEHQRGAPRSLAETRAVRYEDHMIPLLPAGTYTLCSDGLLDQSGGASGFSLGRQGLEQWLLAVAADPPQRQVRRLQERLGAFRGSQPQRDDITLLCFRFAAFDPLTAETGGASA